MRAGNDDKRIKILGLTGGIGTGKSTVADYLKKSDIYHIDADEIGRELTVRGSELLEALDRVFGPRGDMGEKGKEIILEDGTLDRKVLASMAFSNYRKKERLDSIMLKHIIDEIDRRIYVCRDEGKNVLLDAPLLFEAGLEDRCDKVILVIADREIRIERVCKRDGTTRADVENRINCQMSDEEKKSRADIIVDNSGSLEELYRQLEDILVKCVM